MPSPSLVPGWSPIDLSHLRQMTLGDEKIEHEVLSLFEQQAADLMRRLDGLPADTAMLVHTLKGSARAVGATAMSDAALALEVALRRNSGVADALEALHVTAAEARSAIAVLLGRS